MKDIVVETTSGKVRGVARNNIYAFKGLPYGGPTGGDNRFRAPTKPEAWSGVRDALAYGNSCVQPDGMKRLEAILGSTAKEAESEDCLYLNVWTPQPGDREKRPVMFWCHGGGFTMGSGSAGFYNGEHLAERGNVVIVTINHRLGPLGYLYLDELTDNGEYAASGNVGMLDIVAALEWVRDNIAAFGGDPDNVTIFGESGGGVKVSVLLAMPAATGLFHKAIVQSGPGVRVATREVATKRATKLLDALGLSLKELDKLHTLPVEQLFEANASVNPNALAGWGPVVDGTTIPQQPFDPAAPAISAHVPLIIGTNKDEATLFLLGDTELRTLSEEQLYQRLQPLVGDDTRTLVTTYQRSQPHDSPGEIYASIMGDRMMRVNSIQLAERKYAQGAAPVYMYLFTWETPVLHGFLKSCHALEIPFVFDNIARSEGLTGDSPTRFALAEKMSEAWLAFAHTGVPASPKLPTWPVYTPEQRATMIFNDECVVVNDPAREERQVWNTIHVAGFSE